MGRSNNITDMIIKLPIKSSMIIIYLYRQRTLESVAFASILQICFNIITIRKPHVKHNVILLLSL